MNQSLTHLVFRFAGGVFGFVADESSPRFSTRVGSWLAHGSYGLLFGLLLRSVLLARFPEMSDAVLHRVTVTAATIAWIGLAQQAQRIPQRFRLGILPIWVLFVITAYRARLDPVQPAESDPGCRVQTDREPPEKIHLDSLRSAIEGDLTKQQPEAYLDLTYAALMTYALGFRDQPPGGIPEAFRALRLEGESYEQLVSLLRFRVREVDDGRVFDAWFCGYDRECGTCDDRGATYPWPADKDEAVSRIPAFHSGSPRQ